MAGFAILLGFNFLGLTLQHLLHLPIPGNVLGLILFVGGLFSKIIKLEWVETSAQFLLQHMAMFFVPLMVGTMVFFPVLKQNALSIVVGLIGSSLITMAVTGWVTAHIAGAKGHRAAKPSKGSSASGGKGGTEVEA